MSPNSSEVIIASKLSIEFNRIAKNVSDCYIAVGMITDHMFDFAERQLINCHNLQIVCGIHMATTPDVMVKLMDQTKAGKIKAGVYTKRFFHAKLYLFKCNGKWTAYVGSGNFTNGGWTENEELFIKVTEQTAGTCLEERFHNWFEDCEPIDDNFITLYSQNFVANIHLEREKKKNISNLLDKLNSKFNLDNVDFEDQFFKKQEILAFEPGKTNLDTTEVLAERQLVRNKLFLLNSMLAHRIPKSWNIVPHYKPDHIVSHIETKNHHDFNVRSLWIGYGRSELQLKKYDKYPGLNNTPLFFMRMQVIVSYEKVGVWLMPGKNNAGQIDRESFLGKMNDVAYCERFFNLLTGLGNSYWIEVADDLQSVAKFKKPQELKEYITNDNWRYYYFIIGKDYNLGDVELKEGNIVQTCLNSFTKYWPIYEMIRDKTFG